MVNNSEINKHDAGSVIGAAKYFEKTGRTSLLSKADKEYAKFMDPATGELRSDLELINRNCPVCQSNESIVSFYKFGFPHRICNNCSMLYVSPILKEESLNKFYKDSSVYDGVINVMTSQAQRDFDEPKFKAGIEVINKLRGSEPGKLLDIGSLAGHFLEVATSLGWDCTGIELNEKGLELCKKAGLNVINKLLDKNLFPEKSFDVVTLWDVMEHIPDPQEMLDTIKYVLKDDGILLILVPNGGSLAARILRERCNMFNGCQHINLFSAKTLKEFLKDFDVLDLRTIISEFSVLNNYLSYEHPYEGKGLKCEKLLDLITEEALHENFLGYKLQVIARKTV